MTVGVISPLIAVVNVMTSLKGPAIPSRRRYPGFAEIEILSMTLRTPIDPTMG